MLNKFLVFLILVFPFVSVHSYAEEISGSEATEVAVNLATRLGKPSIPWHIEPLYSPSSSVFAFSVTLTARKQKRSFEQELLRAAAVDSYTVRKNDMFFTILVGADTSVPPVISFHEGLPDHFYVRKEMIRSNIIIPNDVEQEQTKIFYENPIDSSVFYRDRFYQKAFDRRGSVLPSTEKPAELRKSPSLISRNKKSWARYKSYGVKALLNEELVIIEGVPDFDQPAGLSAEINPGGICYAASWACIAEYWKHHGFPKIRQTSV